MKNSLGTVRSVELQTTSRRSLIKITPIMCIAVSSITIPLGALVAFLVLSANCRNTGGVANSQFVAFLGGDHCKGSAFGRYKPSYGDNFFQFDSFNDLLVSGHGTYSTACTIYSNISYQNKQTVMFVIHPPFFQYEMFWLWDSAITA